MFFGGFSSAEPLPVGDLGTSDRGMRQSLMEPTQNRTNPVTGENVIETEDARQGEVVLRKPWMQMVFIGGIVGIGVLAVLFAVFGMTG